MCTRVIVLEKGGVGFDGDVDEGIQFLHYDDDEDPDVVEEQDPDAELGSEIDVWSPAADGRRAAASRLQARPRLERAIPICLADADRAVNASRTPVA